jgi:hypothetical protein
VVLAELLRLLLPIALVAALVLVLLPRAAGRIVGSFLGRTPAGRRSPRARRLSRLRTTSGAVALIAAVLGARAAEAAFLGGGGGLAWLLGGAALVGIVAGVVGVRVTSRLLAAADAQPARRVG